MAEPTFNERILDANIAHQIGIYRFREGLAERVVAQLEAVEKDLRKQLNERLTKIQERGYDLGPRNTQRLRMLNAGVRETLHRAYINLGDTLRAELYSLADYEVDFQVRLLQANTPFVELAFVIPPADALRSIVTTQPMRGRLLREMLSDAEAGAVRRANSAIRLGIIEGEPIRDIVNRVVGVQGLGVSKRGATALVRTAVTHTTTRAREALFAENDTLIDGVRWVSTLDGRTTPICQRLDGQVFEINQGPRPPAHISCRSATAPLLNGQSEVFGDRASLVGPVPAAQTYGEWLSKQPAKFQDEVLGPTRGKLFRQGGVTVDRFVDFNGHRYTLQELKLREASAFDRAGL